jgi:hypothetical protein
MRLRRQSMAQAHGTIKSKKSLLPYALYVYADAATGVKIVH